MSESQAGSRSSTLLSSVTEIVSIYLQQNKVEPAQLSQVITSVTGALRGALPRAADESQGEPAVPAASAGGETVAAGNGAQPAAAPAEEQPQARPAEPAVPVKQSVHPDYLICLDCGVRQKLLKKHLRIAHGLTPQEYRRRWHLNSDYPMAAPSFAEGKREMAKRIGLGRGAGKAAKAAPVVSEPARKTASGARRGRPRKQRAGESAAGTV